MVKVLFADTPEEMKIEIVKFLKWERDRFAREAKFLDEKPRDKKQHEAIANAFTSAIADIEISFVMPTNRRVSVDVDDIAITSTAEIEEALGLTPDAE